MKTIGIIGGGAAGMMAACLAKEQNPDSHVMLFEKNAYLGAKVIISGGGRCNVTTGITDVRELLKNYPRGAKFLMTALYRFPPEKVMQWFENHGVPLKTEEDLRVFPKSDNGKDVVGALEKEMRKKNVKIFCKAPVQSITQKVAPTSRRGIIGLASPRLGLKEKKFVITQQDGKAYECDAVIITTGGNAYRHTGSTGDGYAFAQSLGHTITPLAASLSSFNAAEPWVKNLAGVSFEKAAFTFAREGNSKTYERTGAFVFTHRGVSGPAVFALSSFCAYEAISPQTSWQLTIDFFPDESTQSFTKRFQNLVLKNPKKNIENFLDMLLPKSLCGAVLEVSGAASTLMAGSLSKQNREKIISLLKGFPLTIIGRSAGEEFVTAGGVSLSEVNTNTMESKICPGLFFAGEILDIDGFTGGFNLQASWATGALAGECASAFL
ncbi:MAG: NAD(P)/FAD-dependent oxidoreductase [Patescibacteria group bacterium]